MKSQMTNHEAIQFLDNMIGQEHGRRYRKHGFYAELCGYHIQALGIAKKALEEQRTGRWIKSNLDFSQADDFWECSECGWEIYDHRAKTNYCPSCGAKMQEEEDGDGNDNGDQ